MKTNAALVFFVLTFAIHHNAFGQTDWILVSSTIAGGGSETGTIGQWDATPTTDTMSTISGGFWNTDPLPSLRIQRSGGTVIVAWPVSFSGFQLQQSPAVGPGAAWGSVSQPVNVANGENQITMSIAPGTRFLRLYRP